MITILHSTMHEPTPKSISKPRVGSWVHVVDPNEDELQSLSKNYDLDIDLLIDATDIYETPRIERDGANVYMFARYCHPQGREIATEPILIIHTEHQLITIVRIKSNILDRLISGVEPIATTQRTKTVLQILGAINYSYDRNVIIVSKKLLSIRSKLSKDQIKNEYFVQFIDIEEDFNEYLTALEPQSRLYRNLLNSRYLPLYEDDKDLVEDLLLNTTELIDLINSRVKTISNTREAYATIMANTLNTTFKRLTSISIFMTIPAITAALYGMNLALPLARNPYAFWFILAGVMFVTAGCIWIFRRLKWI